MPIVIRSSSYITSAPSSGFSVTLTFPVGTAVGDRVIIATTNGGIGVLSPGWEVLTFADQFFGQICWGVYTKEMTSGDIAAGSVTFSVGLPISDQIWAVAATNGSGTTVRENIGGGITTFSWNGIGAGGSQSVSTNSDVLATDTAILFCGVVGNVVATVTPGTSLAAVSGNVSGLLDYDSSLSVGVNTFSFGGGGTHANFQVAVVLTSGTPPPLGISCDSPPDGIKGSPYTHIFPAFGGVAPYTFSLIGSLPPGLSLNALSGGVSGTPTTLGTYVFSIKVTDSASATATVTCSISIDSATQWVIQEVQTELEPSGVQLGSLGGKNRYTVRCVDAAQIGTFLEFWEGSGGGNSISSSTSTGGGTGPGDGTPQSPPLGPETIAKNGVVVGSESEINFIEGNGIGITAVDDFANGKVDLTFDVTAQIGKVLLKTANYTVLPTDNGSLISVNSSSPVTISLPATPPAQPWFIDVENIGSGLVTVSRNGNTIDTRALDVLLKTDQGAYFYSDGTGSGAYYTERGLSIQGIGVEKNSTLIGTEPNLNLIEGSGVTLTVTDNPGSSRVDVVVAASSGLVAGGYLAIQKRSFSWTLQTTVVLTHNLATTGVIVEVYDSGGVLVTGASAITVTDANHVTLTFGAAFTGTAVVVGGAAYMANSSYQTSWIGQTSVTVTHNLNNSNVIVQVYDSVGVQAVPQNIQILDSNNVVLTFGAAFTGSVIVVSQPTPLPQSVIVSWISQTTVTVFHTLKTTAVIVQIYDAGGNEADAQTVTVVDDHTVVLTFAVAFTGSATIIG